MAIDSNSSVNPFSEGTNIPKEQNVDLKKNEQVVTSQKLSQGLAGNKAQTLTGELPPADSKILLDDKGNKLSYDDQGKLMKKVSFYPSGKPHSQTNYDSKEQPVSQVDYDESGKTINEQTFKDGKLVKNSKFFSEDRAAKPGNSKVANSETAKAFFVKTEQYYADGKKSSEEIKRLNIQEGPDKETVYYDPKGQVTHVVESVKKRGAKPSIVDNVITNEKFEVTGSANVTEYKNGKPSKIKFYSPSPSGQILLRNEADAKTADNTDFRYNEEGKLDSKIEHDVSSGVNKKYNATYDEKGVVHWKFFGEVR